MTGFDRKRENYLGQLQHGFVKKIINCDRIRAGTLIYRFKIVTDLKKSNNKETEDSTNMKILKKIALAALVGASMGVFSTSAMAEASEGRIVYAPKDAIDLTVKKIETALATATSGGDAETVASQAKDALDASKEINANDKVDIARSRANNHLKAARSAAKAGNIPEAEQHLRQGLQAFTALKDLL